MSKCVYVCVCVAGVCRGWARQTQKTQRDREREGRPTGEHCGSSLVVFIGALTTQGWVFPRCSAEQSGHLILTDANTRAQRRQHTRRARTCMHTSHMQPAAVANDVSPDLAKVAFCFTA